MHYLALAEEADPYLREVALRGGHHQLGWLDRLEAEHDNLRAVLDRLAAAGEAELVLRMAGALVEFWFENAHFVELRTRLPAALEADSQPTAPRAKALSGPATRCRSARIWPGRCSARTRRSPSIERSMTLGQRRFPIQARFVFDGAG